MEPVTVPQNARQPAEVVELLQQSQSQTLLEVYREHFVLIGERSGVRVPFAGMIQKLHVSQIVKFFEKIDAPWPSKWKVQRNATRL